MRRALPLLLLAGCVADGSHLPELASYLGQVATRATVADHFDVAHTSSMNLTWHRAAVDITSLQLVYGNWYYQPALGPQGTGAVATIKAGIWYPSGAASGSQVLFSGIAAASVPSGSDVVSDALSVNIPAGSWFLVKTLYQNANGVIGGVRGENVVLPDLLEHTATDKTISGSFGPNSAQYVLFPQAIIAQTTQRSFFLLGTSRTEGYNDTDDAGGDIGILGRWVGAQGYAYSQYGIGGLSLNGLLAGVTKLNVMSAYCSDIIIEIGANNASGDIRASLATIYGSFPSNVVHAVTISPVTTGAWALADGSDQTNTAGTTFTQANAYILTKPVPVKYAWDIAAVQSLLADPTKWKPGYTDDGLHPVLLGNQALVGQFPIRQSIGGGALLL